MKHRSREQLTSIRHRVRLQLTVLILTIFRLSGPSACAGHWPDQTGPANPIATAINSLPKYVVSGSLGEAGATWRGEHPGTARQPGRFAAARCSRRPRPDTFSAAEDAVSHALHLPVFVAIQDPQEQVGLWTRPRSRSWHRRRGRPGSAAPWWLGADLVAIAA
jgi:hypothetical protein